MPAILIHRCFAAQARRWADLGEVSRLLRMSWLALVISIAASGCVHATRIVSRIEETSCSSSDRESLQVSGRLWEMLGQVENAESECFVVAVRSQLEETDPPGPVMAELRSRVGLRVVSASEAERCPGRRRLWVGDPVCRGSTAEVTTSGNQQCPLAFKLQGGLWIPASGQGCE